jgi:hypothetical protein
METRRLEDGNVAGLLHCTRDDPREAAAGRTGSDLGDECTRHTSATKVAVDTKSDDAHRERLLHLRVCCRAL